MSKYNHTDIPSPCYVLDAEALRHNMELIAQVSQLAEVEIILAFKGFSMWSAFPIVREYISGATASSLCEMQLCQEEMKTKAHSYFVAYRPEEFDEVVAGSSHVTFNSINQYEFFKEQVLAEQKQVKFGLRINPEYSEVSTDLYNPAASFSRLGVTRDQMPDELPQGITGLHFHVLCESDSFALENTLQVLESRFETLLHQAKWVNMGGGHLMTREGYDIDHLVQVLRDFKEKYQVDVIMEPGSAFAWRAGNLVTTVLDIVENGGTQTAVIDASFTCHMPDCLEMPYKPAITGAVEDGKWSYHIGGLSCLAGDFIPDYSFEKPLSVGDRLIFEDMIHYTMVKTTTFNGIRHPSIGMINDARQFELIKSFGYEDFKNRLS